MTIQKAPAVGAAEGMTPAGMAATGDLLAVIHELGGKPKHVMLFGHNPEFAELAHSLSSDITEMPTCAVAEFRFDIESWSDVGSQLPTKVKLHLPKES